MTSFPIKSHSEILRVRTSAYEFLKDIVQPLPVVFAKFRWVSLLFYLYLDITLKKNLLI